jgi:2-amino-4-hydroxy-6-hydroxymethyldihydropteridine diphosphokinase
MPRAYIGLGANLGEAASTVGEAMQAIGQLAGVVQSARSSLYRSAPVGYLDQPDFINAVMAVEADCSAHALLDGLLAVESRFGRQRSFRNAPRTLDLDLLLYGDVVIADERLEVPHPRMTERAFVILPLYEIAPGLTLPDGRCIADLVQALSREGLERLP